VEDILKFGPALNSTRPMSRRQFLKTAGIGIAASALLAVSGHSLTTAWMSWMLPASLVRSSFSRRLGETFQVRAESSPLVGMQLVEVRDLRSGAEFSGASEHNFLLSFRGPLSQPIGQGTYIFAHDGIGNFPLFIVPMAPDENARYYEAIFNRQQP
jgi:hypothetical protein